jgi:hypothetical protein
MAEPATFQYAGTVSHGTLRSEDLIEAFTPVLRDLDPKKLERIQRENPNVFESDARAQTVVIEMFDALDRVAPEGYYFGSIEGDGSDFGFWEVNDHG